MRNEMMPPVLYRWIGNQQVVDLLRNDRLLASWKHLMPDTGLLEKGICCSQAPWLWTENSEYVACVAISTVDLPEDIRPIFLDGHAAFNHTNEFKIVTNPRGGCEPLQRQHQVEKILSRWVKEHEKPSELKNEWFLRADISPALCHIIGMVFMRFATKQTHRAVSGYREISTFPIVDMDYLPEVGEEKEVMEKAFESILDSHSAAAAFNSIQP